MKCPLELQAALSDAVVLAVTTNKVRPLAEYRATGLTDERYRWDCLWASGFDTRRLYAAGLDDNHIDTVLRRALPYASRKPIK